MCPSCHSPRVRNAHRGDERQYKSARQPEASSQEKGDEFSRPTCQHLHLKTFLHNVVFPLAANDLWIRKICMCIEIGSIIFGGELDVLVRFEFQVSFLSVGLAFPYTRTKASFVLLCFWTLKIAVLETSLLAASKDSQCQMLQQRCSKTIFCTFWTHLWW